MIKEVLQHILFPDDESLESVRELFYRGDYGRLSEIGSSGHLVLGKSQKVEFNTYLNGVSYSKWKRFTSLENLSLLLDFQGTAEIILVGYKLIQNSPIRVVLSRTIISSSDRKIIELPIPDNEQTVIGFEISSISDFELFEGCYSGSFPESGTRDIELALLTTTFKREEYIRKNMRRLKEGLLDVYPEVGIHIRVHVVDNGRTLTKADLPDDSAHFELHPNPNAGGSGGYARGMIECLHQKPEATHGILMDDDIMILPDSIYRTYQLLRFLKPEYHNHFIGGAMLILEDKYIQHEDSGYVRTDGYFNPTKPNFNHRFLRDNLKNEGDFSQQDKYQAWWYCCIPVRVMKKKGLPLPLFIRGDDVEYGLRCKADIITMNGICLWHKGFGTKYSPTMNVYQEIRNLMIDQAVSDVIPNTDYIGRIKEVYHHSIMKHDYASCELALRALEDYMKGPEFIMEDRGEMIMKENSSIVNKMIPYEEINLDGFNKNDCPKNDINRPFLIKLWYKITWNGHKLWPDRLLNTYVVTIPNVWNYFPGIITRKKYIVALDDMNEKACIWAVDKKRFRELQKRFAEDMKNYKLHSDGIRKVYRERGEYLKSEEFWRKYLKIE